MRLNLNPELAKILDLVRSELKPNQSLYIVGGAVRDVLLGRELNDLDFVLSEDPTSLARAVSQKLNAGFFVLDDERRTARVVYRRDFPLDFVKFTGEDLISDLKHRDFTINAVAIQVSNLEKLIDPLGGIKDLAAGVLRACSDRSLLEDPVRVLRGIRLAMQFNLHYAENLPKLMKAASLELPQTSYERQRDEFFKILEGPKPAEGMMHCHRFDVFKTMIPPLTAQEDVPASPPHTLPLFEHTVRVIKYLDLLLKSIQKQFEAEEHLPWWQSRFLSTLGKYSENITSYFDKQITPGRSRKGLLFFCGLLHDIGKPDTLTVGEDGYLHFYNHAKVGAKLAWEVAKKLHLSNAESEWTQKVVKYHMDLLPLLINDRKPTRKEVYRFYKKTGETGLAIALLILADTLGTYNQNLSQEKWDQALTVCEVLLSAWWEDQESVVNPKLLLNGNDLQQRFGLEPGREIGFLLEKLEEAQAIGEVQTEEEAEFFIQNEMKGSSNESDD
jgi:tRNA nucleotidyltransferase/poly(A) polymerase